MRTDSMTEREKFILKLLAHQGCSQQEIAAEMGVQVQTVKNALVVLRGKAGAESTLELVVMYWRARYASVKGAQEE